MIGEVCFMNKKWIVCIVLLLFILGGFVAYNKKKPETIETLNALINSESVSVQSSPPDCR